MLSLSSPSTPKNTANLKIELRKPFGIGFHRNQNGDGGAVVVQVYTYTVVHTILNFVTPGQERGCEAEGRHTGNEVGRAEWA